MKKIIVIIVTVVLLGIISSFITYELSMSRPYADMESGPIVEVQIPKTVEAVEDTIKKATDLEMQRDLLTWLGPYFLEKEGLGGLETLPVFLKYLNITNDDKMAEILMYLISEMDREVILPELRNRMINDQDQRFKERINKTITLVELKKSNWQEWERRIGEVGGENEPMKRLMMVMITIRVGLSLIAVWLILNLRKSKTQFRELTYPQLGLGIFLTVLLWIAWYLP